MVYTLAAKVYDLSAVNDCILRFKYSSTEGPAYREEQLS
jgi:hypothetical protein